MTEPLAIAPRVRCLPIERSLLEFVIYEGVDEALPYRLLWEAVIEERKEEARVFPDYLDFRLHVTQRQRELIDAVVDHITPQLGRSLDHRLIRLSLFVNDVLQERQRLAEMHPDFATLGHRFLTLPWRRQIMVLERIGLLRDEDPPMIGRPLFEQSFTRALERGGLHHFKVMVDAERSATGLEHRTASPPDGIPQVTDGKNS